MRRLVGFLLLGLLLFGMMGFVLSEDEAITQGEADAAISSDSTSDPSSDLYAEDYEKIQDIVDNLPVDPETGDFNAEGIEAIKLKSQERIDKINSWLEENASWLRFVFRMVPEISWVFFANVYVFLFFFTLFVLNGDEFFFFITSGISAYLSGLALFAIFLVLSVYITLAKFLVTFFDLVLNYLIPYGVVAFIIGVVVGVLALIFFPTFVSGVMRLVARISLMFGERGLTKRALKASQKIEQRAKEIGAYSEGLQG